MAGAPIGTGVAVRALRDVMAACPGMTTADVCADFIKPRTASDKCAYIDQLWTSNRAVVGPATCFVSHAWSLPLAEVVDCAEQYEREHPGTFFWFDIMCFNQHMAVASAVEWWRHTFNFHIRGIGALLFIASPWNRPVTVSRAWCLWEFFSAHTAGIPTAVVIPTSQQAAFRSDPASVLWAVSTADVCEAEASKEEDRREILQVVRSGVGTGELNRRIRELLRDKYLGLVAAAGGTDDVNELLRFGKIFSDFGDYDRALALCAKALDRSVAMFGEQHPTTAAAHSRLGIAYRKKGQHDAALEHHLAALAVRVAHGPGENTADVALSYYHIGVCRCSMGQYDDAIRNHTEALGILTRVFGEMHMDVAEVLASLGWAEDLKGQCDNALARYTRALEICTAVLPKDHPDIGTLLDNIGLVYSSKGEHDKAIDYHKKALTIRLATLGENHSSTVVSYNNIGNSYYSKGEHDQAIEHHKLGLAIRLATSGENHPHTAISYSNIGLAYYSKGEDDKAIEYNMKALAIMLTTLGENHADTGRTYWGLANCEKRRGGAGEARALYDKALRIMVPALGDGHPDVTRLRRQAQACARGPMEPHIRRHSPCAMK